jgi:hypothetical protein
VLLIKYYSGDQIKTEMGTACSTYRKGRKEMPYRVLVGKPEGGRPLGRRARRWENYIKMTLREIEWGHGLERSCSG